MRVDSRSQTLASTPRLQTAVPLGQFGPDEMWVVLLDEMNARANVDHFQIREILLTPRNSFSFDDQSWVGGEEQLRQLGLLEFAVVLLH